NPAQVSIRRQGPAFTRSRPPSLPVCWARESPKKREFSARGTRLAQIRLHHVYCSLMRTRLAGRTDVGLQRDHNEDSLRMTPEYGVVAVADGMGVHRSGDVASQLAVSTLSDFFQITVGRDATWPFPADPNLSEEENYMVTGLRLANRRI